MHPRAERRAGDLASEARSEAKPSEVDQGERGREAPASQRAFTLIEALAAVLLFALAMSMITVAQREAAAFEGDALRRVDASLWAERLLVELEQGAASGAPLKAERREVRETLGGTDYTALIQLDPFDPAEAGLGLAGIGPKDQREARSTQGGLFAPNAQPAAVYQVHVRVSWLEGLEEREVTRASFLLNRTALEAVAARLGEETPE